MNTDKFSTISLQRLFHLTFVSKDVIFGIPKELFFKPENNHPFRFKRFGKLLETPIGVAAGPQTQMAQNIITAWLCGARYIELKTIQTLDELEVSKPCIDMQDEGYNCEWSQELKIHESFDEYLNAWIMIHILRHKFGWKGELGTIFNMSVGYNLEGILKENVQWFFDKMINCKAEKLEKINLLKPLYPEIEKIDIPDCISDNITLSTMHGCPPDEIEKIADYLITEKKLHTTVKLNPTLLGAEKLRKILNHDLEYKIKVPDIAFEHDLKYNDSIKIIKSLQKKAKDADVFFGLKLTNTLEVENKKDVFPPNEKMMYMSGRALHPISINVAAKLQNEFNGELDISFSAGADCFNISDVIACGLKPVTVSSDLLKPGGYGRLTQYIEELTTDFNISGAKSNEEFILKRNGKNNDIKQAALSNLKSYSENVVNNEAYKEPLFLKPNIKTSRNLNVFDCIKAPCVDTCPTHQDIPEYMYWVANNNIENAYKVILRTNPFPSVLGLVCDHLCQTKCTRVNYDNNLLIRGIKRFVTESSKNEIELIPNSKNGFKVSIIGAGPSGLSCAYFLSLAGFEVNVFETKAFAGGMAADAIPLFRLSKEALEFDIKRIEKLGVKIHYNSKISSSKFEKLRSSNNFLYIAAGAQKAKPFGIEGSEAIGVLDPLKFLSDIKNCNTPIIGKNIAIVGGGNTAMDVARTAFRVAGANGKITIIYRRTKNEMPADIEEIKAVIDEGIEILELTAPEKVISENGHVKGLICSKMELSEKDESGRAKPIKIQGSEFTLNFDTIIPALGQDLDIDFVDVNLLKSDKKTYETAIKNVFIGGDAYRGASNIIKAVADGRFTAENIINRASKQKYIHKLTTFKNLNFTDLTLKRAKRIISCKTDEINGTKKSFEVAVHSLSVNAAVKEASRCLYCDELCNVCVTVCPNRANFSFVTKPIAIQLYKAEKVNGKIEIKQDKIFNIDQQYQIINISDFCNECGNCTTFCPTNGSPYRNKPKFYLTSKSFEEAPSGYFISKSDSSKTIHYKDNDGIKTLTLQNGNYIYETKNVKAEFSLNDFKLLNVNFATDITNIEYFTKVAEMKILLDGAEVLYEIY